MIVTQIHRDLDSVLDELIENQQIVAIYQGHSEWGPRALGNRSIMFDPRHPDAKNSRLSTCSITSFSLYHRPEKSSL